MMKTRNLIGMIAFCLFALAACTPSKESEKTLTVLSWNVWHGGHSKTYPEKGCKGTIDILKKSEADVILMVETYGATRRPALAPGAHRDTRTRTTTTRTHRPSPPPASPLLLAP